LLLLLLLVLLLNFPTSFWTAVRLLLHRPTRLIPGGASTKRKLHVVMLCKAFNDVMRYVMLQNSFFVL
jgi:hypothetical protein